MSEPVIIMPTLRIVKDGEHFCSKACQFLMLKHQTCQLFGRLSFNGNRPYRKHSCKDYETAFNARSEVEG